MSLLAVVIIAIIQGVTELFPVSSLGHAVILPALLGLNMDQADPAFLPFLVVLHVGTATALLIYFREDWIGILHGLLSRRAPRRGENLRLLWLMVVASVPVAVLGFLFEKALQHLFAKPMAAAAFLAVNGALLFAAERLRRRGTGGGAADPTDLSAAGALAIGLWQSLALLPGISRSGTTLAGGLLAGLNHAAAARFAFLIATPAIFGASLLEVPKLMRADVAAGALELALLGGVIAGVAAYASTAFLMRYFRRREFQALDPFAWYCALAGLGALALLAR